MSPTVNQILLEEIKAYADVPQEPIKPVEEVEEGVPASIPKVYRKSGAGITRKISKASLQKRRIGFIVLTPGTTHDRPCHSVQMKDFIVKYSNDGNALVVGRDLEQEFMEDQRVGRVIPPRKHRKKGEMVFRSYRVDRILKHSFMSM
jgi:hypothetical protein